MDAKSLIKVVAVVLIVSASSYLTFYIPGFTEDIPITGQSLSVMLCCIFLKPSEALIAILSYLALGGIGLPVFADGDSGWEKFSGGSGGFLYGFLVVAIFISYLGTKGYRKSIWKAIAAMFFSTVLLLFIGNFHLALKYGVTKALEYGLYPFVAGAIIKMIIGAILIIIIEKILVQSKNYS